MLSQSQGIAKRQRSFNTKSRPMKRRRTTRSPQLYRTVIDYKVTDSTYSTTVSDAGAVVSLLGNLTRGDNYIDNFEGGRITPASLEFRVSGTPGDATNVLRVILFQWFDSTTPAAAGVLQLTGAYGVFSPKYLSNRDNINVLADRTWTMDTYNPVFFERIYIKGKKMTNVEFPTGAVTAQKGGIYCLMISDSAAATHPSLDWASRVTFIDK